MLTVRKVVIYYIIFYTDHPSSVKAREAFFQRQNINWFVEQLGIQPTAVNGLARGSAPESGEVMFSCLAPNFLY
jgi:hypothetical protein